MEQLEKPHITEILRNMVLYWGTDAITKLWRTRALQWGMVSTGLKRARMSRKYRLQVPFGVGISPTMACNLECKGCYARFHPKDEEVSFDTLNRFVAEAVRMGVFMFVITGGEPYLRGDMLTIYETFRKVLFITVTNATVFSEAVVRRLSHSRNVVPMLSIEGTEQQTDARRGAGVHAQVLKAMELLSRYKLIFGFSSVLTKHSIETLGSEDFIREMISRGCSIGFFNDLIPFSGDDREALPSPEQAERFKEHIRRLRSSEPIVLVHLPEDEYNEEGWCTAVGTGGFHVTSQGFVEPCPFAHYARENIKHHSFKDILRSPFLSAIRSHPTALYHGDIGCSLYCNVSTLQEIARRTGAQFTDACEEPAKGWGLTVNENR